MSNSDDLSWSNACPNQMWADPIQYLCSSLYSLTDLVAEYFMVSSWEAWRDPGLFFELENDFRNKRHYSRAVVLKLFDLRTPSHSKMQ